MSTTEYSTYFDFLAQIDLDYTDVLVKRMNWRHAHIVAPLKDEIKGARILDLGSHDGRWPIAYADAGAREVIGIEGRQTLVDQFDSFQSPNKDRVRLEVGDFVDAMDRLRAAGETFDIVSCLGVYYHTMQHYRMMCQMASFRPSLIIIDSEFAKSEEAIIRVGHENPASKMNSTVQFSGQNFVPVGYPSRLAVRRMAKSVGYDLTFVKWNVPDDQREPVEDYYGSLQHRIRLTALLRPFKAGSGSEQT
jgi:Methyltransferase domain